MEQAYDIGEQRAFPIPISKRADGLNHIAKLRSERFGIENKELESFFKEMRDRFDPMYKDNKKIPWCHSIYGKHRKRKTRL